ncbi:MAG: DUF2382 domain-containing protein [Bacillota bacterium]|nr:DUF2382 domain-containing protein [Bacillota bacterium]
MNKKIQLKEEKMDLRKIRVKRGEADIRRDIYTRYITLTLPIKVEDLVVKKETDGIKKTIRIPLTKETYVFIKKKKTLNEIKIYKKYSKNIKHIEVGLKKEKLNVKIKAYAKE